MKKIQGKNNSVDDARVQWLQASERASRIAMELFQPGSGYGDPGAQKADEHRLQSAREEAERLFRQYHDLDRREMEQRIFEIQRSQHLATWASFAVAAVVGVATVLNILVELLKLK